MFSKVFRTTLIITILSISLGAMACIGEGESVGNYPGAPDCCEGLTLKPAPEGVFGAIGTCERKATCLEEGESVGNYPGAPDCCEGLTLEPAPEGLMGSAGRCVSKSLQTINVNDSRIQSKDPQPGFFSSPSSGSRAGRQ